MARVLSHLVRVSTLNTLVVFHTSYHQIKLNAFSLSLSLTFSSPRRLRKVSSLHMAPKRKNQPPPTTSFTRVTRSSAKRSADEPEPVPEKKPKKPKTAAVDKKPKQDPPKELHDNQQEKPQPDSSNKTIVIEHCKQCQQFKKRAYLVKEGLEKGVAGITVIVNPEKPRRGCFEIREEGGEKFITLLDMKRPFQPMRDLDMDKVISDIIDKIGK